MPRRVHRLLVAGLGLVAAACASRGPVPRPSAETAAGPSPCVGQRLLMDSAVYTALQWRLERAMVDTALQGRLNRAMADTALQGRLERAMADTALQARLERAVADTTVQARIAQLSSHVSSCPPGRR